MAKDSKGLEIRVTMDKRGPIWTDQFVKESRKGMREIFRKIGIDMVEKFKEATPIGAYGKLANSWRLSPMRQNSNVIAFEVTNTMVYANAVEQGRKPAPVNPKYLYAWVKAKFRTKPRTQKEVRIIARRIANMKKYRYTPGQEFARRTFERNAPRYVSEFGIRLAAFYRPYSS